MNVQYIKYYLILPKQQHKIKHDFRDFVDNF